MTEREKLLIERWVINMELTFGCRVKNKLSDKVFIIVHTDTKIFVAILEGNWDIVNMLYPTEDNSEILWHPLYIGDVIEWACERQLHENFILELVGTRWDTSKPFHLLSDGEQEAIYQIL
jgi:hypothetical protein